MRVVLSPAATAAVQVLILLTFLNTSDNPNSVVCDMLHGVPNERVPLRRSACSSGAWRRLAVVKQQSVRRYPCI